MKYSDSLRSKMGYILCGQRLQGLKDRGVSSAERAKA